MDIRKHSELNNKQSITYKIYVTYKTLHYEVKENIMENVYP